MGGGQSDLPPEKTTLKSPTLLELRKVFLINQETELSNPKNKKFQEVTFRSPKVKITTLKKFLIFGEWHKRFKQAYKNLYFRRRLAKPKNQKFLRFFYFFCFLRENFSNISAKENRFLHFPTFPYKEAKFSKLKYFFVIIIKLFFLIL